MYVCIYLYVCVRHRARTHVPFGLTLSLKFYTIAVHFHYFFSVLFSYLLNLDQPAMLRLVIYHLLFFKVFPTSKKGDFGLV